METVSGQQSVGAVTWKTAGTSSGECVDQNALGGGHSGQDSLCARADCHMPVCGSPCISLGHLVHDVGRYGLMIWMASSDPWC